jgi:hypothetical protein
MRPGPGRHSTVSNAQREELWRRYKAGESVLWISRVLRQRPTNLYRVLQASGGIEPLMRTRSPRVLTLGEREEISRGLAAGTSGQKWTFEVDVRVCSFSGASSR